MNQNNRLAPPRYWEEYNEVVAANAEIHETLLAQQQQIRDIEKVLASITKIIEKSNGSPPDYQPLFIQLGRKLQKISEQHQYIQEIQNKEVKALDRLSENLQEMKQSLTTQAKNIGGLSTWQKIAQLTLIAVMLMIIASYALIAQNNNALDKKLDRLNSRSEKIYKKVQ
jgi:predicted PurR-regulated permease PerM